MPRNTPDGVWKYIEKAGDDECWPYIGRRYNTEYGMYQMNNRNMAAHRVVYELTFGEIPAGMFVMHKCNNRPCCNPNHLTLGTNSKNQRHASSCGAWPTGKSGVRGVYFEKYRGYWTAQGYLNNKRYNLYTGPSKEKAIAARKKWESENLVTFPEIS